NHLVVVVSAMGKTTNALEKVVYNYFHDKKEVNHAINEVLTYHHHILSELFPDKKHVVYEEVAVLFKEMKRFLELNKSPNHPFVYDQIVSFGELISTKIISIYLNEEGVTNTWLDSRECIKTDSNHRDAGIDWETTKTRILENVPSNA